MILFVLLSLLFSHNSLALASETLFGPVEYQKEVAAALQVAKGNVRQIARALDNVGPYEREAMAFLIAHMPSGDLKRLKADFLIENVHLAYQAVAEVPWGPSIPVEVFLNDVLPYAVINERRDRWRQDFYDRFIQRAKAAKSIPEAVRILNEQAFEELKVEYHPTKRPKPDQSPYESMKAHYASCTGLSVLLVDILRSVGIPARIVGIPLWADETGNHTWVEVWEDGIWHHIGAWEPTELDQAWFTDKAVSTDSEHPIFATSFKKTGVAFPMVWAPENKTVWGIDVTENYRNQAWNKN